MHDRKHNFWFAYAMQLLLKMHVVHYMHYFLAWPFERRFCTCPTSPGVSLLIWCDWRLSFAIGLPCGCNFFFFAGHVVCFLCCFQLQIEDKMNLISISNLSQLFVVLSKDISKISCSSKSGHNIKGALSQFLSMAIFAVEILKHCLHCAFKFY